MRYELTDLKLFYGIAQAQSLSIGAHAVNITASSASYRLKNLEQALGTPLFLRTAKGMELTPAGETLYRHVRVLLAGIELMHDEVGRFSAGLKGHIRLLANSSSLNSFILPSVSRFLVAHPNVNIDLEERRSAAIAIAIAAQEADVGIVAGDVDSKLVTAYPYATDELIVVTPIDHPLALQSRIQFAAALDFDFVCMGRASSNFVFLQEMVQRIGRPLNARLHAHSYDAVLTLVQAGVGVALVPRSVAAATLAKAGVAAVRLEESWAVRKLNMIVRSKEELPAFTKAFVEFLLVDPRVAAMRNDTLGSNL